ncbi:sulfotransferase domain-containing protein [Streptosporangium lutulentum]
MPALKCSVHTMSRAAGRLTARSRILPSFLIVGAQRCGTTSLYRALSQHPLMLKPVLHKGVHYFDMAYDQGLSWYRAHFPLRPRVSRLSYRYGYRPQAFESSPYYLFHPLASARIAWDLPGVKLIVLTRDPVERAFSAHAHELARGFETETSFARAVELEEERLAGAADDLCVSPTRRTTPTATSPTSPEAATPNSSPGSNRWSAANGCSSWTAGGSSPSRRSSTTGCWRSSDYRTSVTRSSNRTTPGPGPLRCPPRSAAS